MTTVKESVDIFALPWVAVRKSLAASTVQHHYADGCVKGELRYYRLRVPGISVEYRLYLRDRSRDPECWEGEVWTEIVAHQGRTHEVMGIYRTMEEAKFRLYVHLLDIRRGAGHYDA